MLSQNEHRHTNIWGSSLYVTSAFLTNTLVESWSGRMSSPTKDCKTLASKRGQKKTNKSTGLKRSSQHVVPMSDGCVCNVCGKSLKSLSNPRRHVCIAHSKDKEMVVEREKSYCCHHCGKLFSSVSGLKVHESKHAMLVGPEVCDLCCTHFMDEASLNRHKQLKHWKPNMWKCHCLMCGFSTTNLQYLKRHLKSHLGTKPYGCQKCDKWFEWKGYLKAHVKAVHENTRPYPCEICGKQFKQKTSLSVHNKSEHTGEKPYSCSKCPKAFVRASSLRDHMKCHLLAKKPKKQYCCHLCNDRPFLDKTCLAVHMASAHSDDKPYMCDVCGKGFKLKNCLRVHTQAHSEERPYYCQLCDGAFKSKKDLKKHQERHKSSKDHICGTCGKGFVTKNDVYLHQKVHDPSKDHRIYKPGKYKVSEGELLTARTRKNKLSLKEQEPISFDTEINGTGSLKLKKISKEKESHTSSEVVLTDVPKSVSPSLGNKELSRESLSFETFLDTSDDSNEFHGFGELDNASDAKSPVDKYLSNSSDSSKDYSVGPSGHELETHERWNSVELLEDYDWLDASSSQDDAVAKGSDPLEDSLPSEHLQGSQFDGSHTPVHKDVTLLHCDDSQIDGSHTPEDVTLLHCDDSQINGSHTPVHKDVTLLHCDDSQIDGSLTPEDVSLLHCDDSQIDGSLTPEDVSLLHCDDSQIDGSLTPEDVSLLHCDDSQINGSHTPVHEDVTLLHCDDSQIDGSHTPEDVTLLHCDDSQIDGSHTPEDVSLLHCDDSQSIDSMLSLTSSLHEFPDFNDHEVTETLADGHVTEEEDDVTLCESDVDLQSLNEYLNDELNNSQSLTQVNMDAFTSSLHSAESKRHHSEDVQDSQSSLGDSYEGGVDRASKKENAGFVNVSKSDSRKFDSMFTPDNGEIGFCGEGLMEIPRNDHEVFLKSGDHALSAASSQLEVKKREKQLLIDFQMTSCDMFNDTSDIFEDSNALDAKHAMDITHKYENRKNAVSFLRSEPSSDSSYLSEVETEDNLTEVETEDNLTEIETEDNLTEVETEDNLTEVETEDNMAEVETEDNIAEVETEDNMAEVETEDNIAEAETEDNMAEVETEDNMAEVETEDNMAEVETEDNMAEVETEDNLAEVETEDNIAEVETEDNMAEVETEDNMAEVETEDNMAEVETEDNMAEVEMEHAVERDSHTQDYMNELEIEDDLTVRQSESHITKREHDDQIKSGHKTEDQQVMKDNEVEQKRIINNSVKRRERYRLVELVSEPEEFAHGIVRARKQRKLAASCWKCSVCAATLTSRDGWNRHQQSCKISSSHGKQRKLAASCWKCSVCAATLTSRDGWNRHQQSCKIISSHGKQRKLAASCWKCSVCAATLTSRDGWNRHQQSCKISSSHGTKKFRCDDCGRSYTTQSNLNTHWAACHAAGGNHSFVCHLCGHICNDKQNLRNHMVRHSSARPFRCDLCQKCFKTRVGVRGHLNKHLPSKMLFQCDLCSQFYNHFNSLRVHKQTHLSVVPLFTCNICGRQLSDRSNLTAHTKRHLVPRKYQCTVCTKELSSAHSLQGHQGRACLKHQLKTLKTREKAERCLVRKKAKEERLAKNVICEKGN